MAPNNGFAGVIEAIVEHVKGFILAAFVIVAVLGAIGGYRYYAYTQDDPQFCASCHLMSEAFKEWEKGKHRDIVCQKCHRLSIFEKNQLLVAFVVKGKAPLAQTHGREKPWKACRDCHMDNIAQGMVTTSKSYGHAKHVFMQGVECKTCHKGTLHVFSPNEDACFKCHEDKIIHGAGKDASSCRSCLKCHSFSEKSPSMIPRERCTRCHTNFPKNAPMSELLCHKCHHPHGKVNPTAATCVSECHGHQGDIGQHGLHIRKGLTCMDCHKAHSWVVGKENAKTLCSRCHAYKEPRLFIN